MTPTSFMNCLMVIDPTQKCSLYHGHQCACVLCCCRAPHPPVLPGITILYVLLKVCGFLFNAIPDKAKGRVAVPTSCSGGKEHGADLREEGNSKICKQIQGYPTEKGHYGRWPEESQGTILVQRRGQNICLPSLKIIGGIQQSNLYEKMKKGLQSRRYRNSAEHYGTGPKHSCTDATRIFEKRGSWDDASHVQPTRNGRKDKPK